MSFPISNSRPPSPYPQALSEPEAATGAKHVASQLAGVARKAAGALTVPPRLSEVMQGEKAIASMSFAGAALVVGGTAMLAVANKAATETSARVGLNVGGGLALALGTGALVGAVVASRAGSSFSPAPSIELEPATPAQAEGVLASLEPVALRQVSFGPATVFQG